MITIREQLVKIVMEAMYDREPELHPQDAYGMAQKFVSEQEVVKKLTIQIVSKRSLKWLYLSGLVSGFMLGIIAFIIWHAC